MEMFVFLSSHIVQERDAHNSPKQVLLWLPWKKKISPVDNQYYQSPWLFHRPFHCGASAGRRDVHKSSPWLMCSRDFCWLEASTLYNKRLKYMPLQKVDDIVCFQSPWSMRRSMWWTQVTACSCHLQLWFFGEKGATPVAVSKQVYDTRER